MSKKFILAAIMLAAFASTFSLVTSNSSLVKEFDVVPAKLKASYAYKAAKWYNDARSYPAQQIPSQWKENALAQIEKESSLLARNTSSSTGLIWHSIGPTNVGGRIRSIVIDPQHPDTMVVGSVSGGIWKTTNGGALWFPTCDFADNICIGTIVMNPANPNTLYAGTGEGYFNIDALRGAGVLRSTDGGASWTTLTNFSTPNSHYSYYYINKLVIRPDNPSVLYAAMNGGIWKTTNAGTNWSKLSTPNTSVFCMDLVASPQNPDLMFASFGLFYPDYDGIYRTTNGGSTWTKLTSGLPANGYTRISLAVAPTDSNVVYACVADSNFYTYGMYKTTNKGNSWNQLSTPIDNSISGSNKTHLGGQGFYNNVIAVSPQNANTVYTGGIRLFKSTNGGSSWSGISTGAVHVDEHAIVFHPANPSVIYFGNDGGLFKSTDAGSSFSSLNNNLTVTQFYSGAIHPAQNIFYGGTQDNGTLMTSSPATWSQILSGDGGPVLVDYQNPANVYMSYVFMSLWKSTNGGPGPVMAHSNISTDGVGSVLERCSFIAPFIMDPSNPQVLYAGSYRLYKTSNGASSWSILTSDLTGSGSGGAQTDGATITAIAAAKSDATVLYVGTSGWTGVHSRVLSSTNSGTSWTIMNTAPLPDRSVTSFAIDPLNASRAFVTFSGFDSNTPSTHGHVFLTTNLNGSWTNISGNLPDVPVNCILLDPGQNNHLIIGTDLGIFETTNSGTTWSRQNDSLANVAVFDLDLRSDGVILAATHGRGIFTATLQPPTAVHETDPATPKEFELYQNYPNPFNPSTVIRYQIPGKSFVSLKVFNAVGQEIANLVDGVQDAGYQSVTWNASNQPGGVYFYELRTNQNAQTMKMLLLR